MERQLLIKGRFLLSQPKVSNLSLCKSIKLHLRTHEKAFCGFTLYLKRDTHFPVQHRPRKHLNSSQLGCSCEESRHTPDQQHPEQYAEGQQYLQVVYD